MQLSHKFVDSNILDYQFERCSSSTILAENRRKAIPFSERGS